MSDIKENYIEIKIKDFYKQPIGETEYVSVSPEVYEEMVNTFRKEAHAEYMRDVRNRTEEGYVEGSTEDLLMESVEALEDIVMQKIEIETLHRAIQSLTEVQKERLRMYFFEELNIDEIARICGSIKMPVWRSIQDAMKKIKKYFI